MGQRGPAPKPTPILRMTNPRAARKRERTEPRPPPEPPECPGWIDDAAKAAWEELVPMLQEMKVLSRIDGRALSRYCQHWARWKRAEQFIQQYGSSYALKDERGQIKCFAQYPEVAIANKLAIQLTRLEAEFGMTPSARTRINVPVAPAEHPEHSRCYTFTADMLRP